MHTKPPPRHHLAVMIWLAVFPTLAALQLLFGSFLRDAPMLLRTFFLATATVPIVVYVLLPPLQKVRARLVGRRP
ncbi:hypothetical protein AB0F72_27770 [Actinoplanes sp. NPDC023936]|uniref:hypothetical protein n=1 Tax=Actinoplanes sp. NPDC023936 TaxID=3154910 RepID=UPI0033C48272